MKSSIRALVQWSILCLLCHLAHANVEKLVFSAPQAGPLPSDASIDNLLLPTLSAQNSSLRTFLNASFPTRHSPKGTQTWVLLEHLTPGRRYEVRVNWIATQPTQFWLYGHTMHSVFASPDLLSALTAYSNARHHQSTTANDLGQIRSARQSQRLSHADPDPALTTPLFLQIFAKADYYTLNATMMDIVPPVQVDLILDPYLLSILPTTLLPTVGFILAVAVGSWLASGWIIKSLLRPLASRPEVSEGKKRR
ncbi:hypothetical protein DV737_g1286, partial [Chaetothyriales sp. CBS 132003]